MKRFKILTFLSLLVAVLTACPSNSSNKTAPSIGSLTATPSTINEGDSSTLAWTVTGSPTPTLSINQGVGTVTGTSTSVTPTTTTTYTLTATNSEGNDTKTVTVTVNPAAVAPNITSFTATPSTINEGDSSTLAWTVTGSPTSLTIDQGVGPVTGSSTSVTPTTTTTYTLTATNAQGSDTATVTVTVSAAPVAPTITSFTATPSTINEGDSSTLAWTVTGSPTPTLSINQGVGTVTGSSTSVTPTTTTTYTLTATNSEGNATEDVTVTVTPLTATINGVVVDFNNQPVANVPVVIFGENNGTLSTTALTAQTNTDGEFSLSGVKKPYDIAAIFNNATPPGATVYLSLTREDPRLIFIGGGFGTPKQAAFNGTVTATGSAESYPLPANHFDRGVFGSPDVIDVFGINNATGDFTNNFVAWFGNQTTTGAIHVLQWEGSSNLPTSFTGYGSRENVVLADSNTANDQDVEITGLGSLNAGGSINVPSGYTINDKDLNVIFDANSRLTIGSDSTPNANFNFVTPQINGATLELVVEADDGPRESKVRRNGFALNDQNITINIPEAPSLSLPVDNAPNVNIGTEFSWSPFGFNQSVYGAQFNSAVSQFFVVTEDTSITIPDLSSIGLPLGPPSATTTYNWNVFGIGPLNDIDAAASQTLFDLASDSIQASETVQGESQTFSFDVVMP